MSTEHHGGYCRHKDKMMLSRERASMLAARLSMCAYQCGHCGHWHLAHRRHERMHKASRYTAVQRRRDVDRFGRHEDGG